MLRLEAGPGKLSSEGLLIRAEADRSGPASDKSPAAATFTGIGLIVQWRGSNAMGV